MHAPDTIVDESRAHPGARHCPAWVEAIPSFALRWGVVTGCLAAWSGVIYGIASIVG